MSIGVTKDATTVLHKRKLLWIIYVFASQLSFPLCIYFFLQKTIIYLVKISGWTSSLLWPTLVYSELNKLTLNNMVFVLHLWITHLHNPTKPLVIIKCWLKKRGAPVSFFFCKSWTVLFFIFHCFHHNQ